MLNSIRSPLDGIRSPFGPLRDSLARVIALLFSNNEPGFLTPISTSVCFTDTAGTTQAQVGQAVARVNDQSGRGNNWTQPTLANRPILGRKPKGGRRNILRQTATLATQTLVVTAAQHTLSFRGTGTVTLSGASTSGPLVGTGANDLVSLTFTPTAGNLTLTVSGTVNDAQLELGAVRTAYQLVADAGGFDVTEAGKADCHYLFCGGSADPRWMQTPTITPGTDKVQVFAGVRKLSGAAAGGLVNHSTLNVASAASTGTFRLLVPANTFNDNDMQVRGASSLVFARRFFGIRSAVVSGLSDTAAPSTTIRIDGVGTTTTTGVGAIDFRSAAMVVGDAPGVGFFNGEIYALGVRFGPNLDTATIEQVERYVASLVAEDTI
jgi:hypothetical protein